MVVWVLIHKFADILIGAEFLLLTDNNPHVHLEPVKLGALEKRGMPHLSKFYFKTQYCPGWDNANADALSHNPIAGPRGAIDEDREEVETLQLCVMTSVQTECPSLGDGARGRLMGCGP